MRKFYDMMDDGSGGWIMTTDPDYDPNKKNWWQRLALSVKLFFKRFL